METGSHWWIKNGVLTLKEVLAIIWKDLVLEYHERKAKHPIAVPRIP